ncbi:MAG: flagellar motor switch protein FliN [Myxococcales bacterium]|nr:flagellar motor switch protein FliN [Myxococcales bacterium]|tara:strand:- start:1328 stop:1687 length:360 start_codon:yes stop_codon:yes gene_type:complete
MSDPQVPTDSPTSPVGEQAPGVDAALNKAEDDLTSLERIMDIPLVVSVELGRTRMLVGDLLQLGAGSVIELTKLADEPLDVFVHGKLVARGEAVVVNDKFGVRLTDIVSPTERLQSLST